MSAVLQHVRYGIRLVQRQSDEGMYLVKCKDDSSFSPDLAPLSFPKLLKRKRLNLFFKCPIKAFYCSYTGILRTSCLPLQRVLV